MFYQNMNHQSFLLVLLISILTIALILLIKAMIEEKKEANIEQEFVIVLLRLLIVFITTFIIGLIGIMIQNV